MPVTNNEVSIEAAPAVLWEYISDIRQGPEWVTVMQEVTHVSDEPIEKGSVYREVSIISGKETETEWTVTKFDPPRVQVHECRNDKMHADLTMTVEPDGEHAKLIHTVD